MGRGLIIWPDFLDHWKTRHLVEITGDQSAPLALIRLWGYCHTSKGWSFPEMTPVQLSSICHWGNRKPACHSALIKCGFIQKLSPKGFATRQWSEHNAQLIASWKNGATGGRPRNEQKSNEYAENKKPVGSAGLPQAEPIDRIDKTDKNEINIPLPLSGEGGEKTETKGPLQVRAGKMFGRKPETPLTSGETRAFKKNAAAIKATSEEDWKLLEDFYAAPQEQTFSRKELATLVNNWNGEIDRSKAWKRNPQPTAGASGISEAQQRMEWNASLARATKELETLGPPSNYPEGDPRKSRIKELRAGVSSLRAKLGVVA